ncbi:Ig-like domain repeat protein [Tunturiibacter empetritectus]|uniref:Ig-like domain repeat protein n=1 Tax=Tunturiibacter empetritectus TaxID=3069691 RepID=UPI003D9B824E
MITGTLVNGDTYTTAVTGAATYSAADTPTSAAGSTFPISVSGLSSANYEIALVNGTLTIVSAPTTTTLTTSTNSAQYGDPVTLTATVAPSGATGTVLFMQGANVLGTGTVSGGVATLTTATLNAGTYTITSSYQGDTDYGAKDERSYHADHQPEVRTRRHSGSDGDGSRRQPTVRARKSSIQL